LTKINEKSTNLTHFSNFPFGNPSTLDNSTLMGKLIGFIKTGRHLGSVEISDLNPCLKGSCEKWKKGLESLREFFSKSTSKVSDLFKNSATLRKISEETGPTLIKDPTNNSTRKSNVTTKHRNVTVLTPLKVTPSKEPIDYFDYYYNGDEKKPSSPSINNRTIDTPSRKNVSIASSNNVLTGARKMADYFDYYYHQGIPPFTTNKTQFVGGKSGG